MTQVGYKSGIYQIRNLINNKIYVGSTNDFKRRMNYHFSLLKRNNHTNKHIQSAYNKYGRENFIFEILITCHPELLLWYEQQFIDQWKPEYNVLSNAGSMKGYHHTDESKLKISKRHKGVPKTKDHVEKVRLAVKGIKPTSQTIQRAIESSSKLYKGLISPDGIIYENIFNMSKFCREHGLDKANIFKVTSGERLSHRHWKAL